MAESQQANVQVQCSNGTFINILLDASMAEQLKNGQIFITEENGQIGIQQQNGQISSLEYVNQVEVQSENAQNVPGKNNVENIEPKPMSSKTQIEQDVEPIGSNAHIEENNRLRALIGLPPIKGSAKNNPALPQQKGAF